MYKALEMVLQRDYGASINITKVAPLHDEDFEADYAVCYDDTILCNANFKLKYICNSIELYLERISNL